MFWLIKSSSGILLIPDDGHISRNMLYIVVTELNKEISHAI
jgi:hypothetical protein